MPMLHPVALALLTLLPLPAKGAPRPPDTACVALLLPSVEGVEDVTAVATSVRAVFESYLTGPSIKSVMLDAKLASQATQEARQKECETILTVTVTRKASGNGGSKVGTVARVAGSTAAYVPLPNYGAAIAVGAARSGADAVASVASTTHAKDEMQMTYKVTTADGAPILALKSESVKAKSDGEDILTPLIARASEAVATAVTKK